MQRYLCVMKSGWSYKARMTVNSPSLGSNEIAIRLTLNIPDTLFERPALTAKITVPEDSVNKPEITAEVIDNISEVVSKQLGIDLQIVIVETEAQ